MYLALFITLIGLSGVWSNNEFIVPEQIHLSYGDDPSSMVVMWSTMNATRSTEGRIGPASSASPPTFLVTGTSRKFVAPGDGNHTQYIHRVKFTQLKPGDQYIYMVGSKAENVWSSRTFRFRAMRDGYDWSPSIALYGDFGVSNSRSLERLYQDKEKHMYDAVLHVGDFAYDMDTDNGIVGDKFMNMVQNLSAELPYMTCPGNHESAYNFTHYKNRFSMPRDENMENMFYSFNMGPIHFISISTEYYFFLQYGFSQPFRQYYWLENDLKEANKPENRAKRPWIIAIGHRPMYCSNTDHDDCTKHHSLVRDGIPLVNKYGLEKMFYDYGVDLAVWAHEHSYERLWPLYADKAFGCFIRVQNLYWYSQSCLKRPLLWRAFVALRPGGSLIQEVYNGSVAQPYTNPKAPVHVITGSAGCQENHNPFQLDPKPWSAFRSTDYGYTRMKVYNSTHLYFEQVSDDKEGAVIDKVMLIKDKHGSFAPQ